MNARKPRTKSKNFSSEETSRLLDLVEELKPFGGNMWERVAFEYNRTALYPLGRSAMEIWRCSKRPFGQDDMDEVDDVCVEDLVVTSRLGKDAADFVTAIKWKEQAELHRQEFLEREESKKEQAEQRRRDDETRRQELKDREEREREARKREQQHELVMMSFMAKLLGNSN
ncbi:hypothetical protein DYB25_003224 [Aphanomyces astaci]|uniref:Myb-like domain-containing protein n=1 Tax=Aphanomyces astaci TaxID=112090 RepID=A0A397BJF9_APHAT|nr:hypothetical protein DYB25_003224 [Aphanomyces astaci]